MVKVPLSRAALAALICALLPVSLAAEQTGEIRGTIADPTRAALSGVLVTARSPRLQGQRTAVSDETGFFRLPLLPVGTYELSFERSGFEKQALAGQEVSLGYTATLSVAMRLAGVAEEVTVTRESPLIDATSADTSYRLGAAELRWLPTSDRTISELVQFTPGVTGVRASTITGNGEPGNPSFRGEGEAGNNWLVDGLSTRGSNYNDPAVRINYDAWEEVQVVSDGFAPELGHALGGFVNVVTKSGGNTFNGEMGALLRPQSFRAERQEQLSAASLPQTGIQNYFGNLGGPIVRDKLWFFVSDNVFSTLDVTSDQALGWLEIPAGERRVTTNNLFGKLTFSPATNHTVSATGSLDKSLWQSGGIGVPETYAETSYDHQLYRLNYRGILSPRSFLTAAAGHHRRDYEMVPLSGDFGPPSYFWQDIAQATNNIGNGWSGEDERTDLAVAASWLVTFPRAGRHELRAGLSHYWNSTAGLNLPTGRDLDPWKGDGFDDGSAITWAERDVPLSMMEFRVGPAEQSTRGFGLYVQDAATLGPVSLMLGLRAETQDVFNDVGRKLWAWGLADFLQPRVALSVDLGGQRTLLKLAYGRFAMPVATAFLASYNTECTWCFRRYDWIGPAQPTEAQLRDSGNWSFTSEQSAAAMPAVIDPGLRPNKIDRVLLGLEQKLAPGWVLKLRGIRSLGRDLLEDYGSYDSTRDPNLVFEFTNLDLKRRDYWAAEAELNARVGDRLQLDAAYTWSSAKGTVPGNGFESGTCSMMWGGTYESGPFGDHPYVPEGDPNKVEYDALFGGLGGLGIGDEGWYGFLPYSVDHGVKVLARYHAPWDVRLSASFEWLSGYHWEKKGWVPYYGGFLAFPEDRGGRTTPAHAYFDLAIGKDLKLGKGLVLDLGVNVYNLFNSQTPVSYAKEDTDLFGQVWGRQLPRWVQIRAGLRF